MSRVDPTSVDHSQENISISLIIKGLDNEILTSLYKVSNGFYAFEDKESVIFIVRIYVFT